LGGGAAGNGSSSGDGGTTTGGSGSRGLTQITLGVPQYGVWSPSVRWIIARERGFFEQQGLEVSKLDVSGGGANIRAMVAGDADVAMSTGAFAGLAAYSQSDIVAVGNSMNSDDHYWFSRTGSGISSMDNCGEYSLGFSNPGGSSHMISKAATDGFDCGGAQLKSIGGPGDELSAVLDGNVDLGWGAPSLFLDQFRNDEIQIVFRGKEVKPFDSMSARMYYTTPSFLEREGGDIARSYFTAVQQATKWTFENFDEHFAIVMEALEVESQNRQAFRKDIKAHGYEAQDLDLTAVEDLETANQLAVENDFIDEPLSSQDLRSLVNTDLVPPLNDVSV
jgi:NitT/TauT family transport system substrate-binding protein